MISGNRLGAVLGRFWGPQMGSNMVKFATWRPGKAVPKSIEKRRANKKQQERPTGRQRSGNGARIGRKARAAGETFEGFRGGGAGRSEQAGLDSTRSPQNFGVDPTLVPRENSPGVFFEFSAWTVVA